MKQRPRHKAFTLAELLTVLTVLSIISSITIPKLLTTHTNTQNNALSKEFAGLVAEAYTLYRQNNMVTNATKPADLIPYINGIKDLSGHIIDSEPLGSPTGYACDSANRCLLMQSGAVVMFYNNDLGFEESPSGVGGIQFGIDTDGQYRGSYDSQWFVLYRNGRLTDFATAFNNPTTNASWFRW